MELSAGWHTVDSDDEWTEARFVADGDKQHHHGPEGDFDRVSATATVTGSTPRTPGTPSSRHSRADGRVSPPAARASTALIVQGTNRVRRAGKAALLCNLSVMRLPTAVPRAVLEQRLMQVPNANPALLPIGQQTVQQVGGALTATQLKVITAFTESKAPRTLMKSERAFNDRALQRQAGSLRPRHGADPAMQHAARRHHAQQHHHFGHHTETRARFGAARSGEISKAPAFGGRR